MAVFAAGGVGADGWYVLVEVTDTTTTDTDSSSLRDQAMGAFAQISVNPVTVAFGTLTSNSNDNPITDPRSGTFDATSVSNQTHALTIQASTTWSNGATDLTLDQDGNPGVNKISSKADDDANVADAQFVTANEAFKVSADETKEIQFVVRTVFISDVTLTPRYRGESAELSFVAMTYSLNNLGSPAAAAEVILKVTKDNAPFNETSILSLDTLVVGTTRGSRNYIPPADWESGVYKFKAELFVAGSAYISSLEATISAGPQAMVGSVTETPFLPTPMVETALPPMPTPAATFTPESTNGPQPTPGNTARPAATPILSDSLISSPAVAVLGTADISAKVSDLGVVLEKVVLVSLDGRANVEIPQGTLALSAEEQPLSVLEIRPADSPTPLLPDTKLIGVVYAFGPAGPTFSPQVNVSLEYDPTDLSLIDGGEELAILRYDVDLGWTRLETSVDAANSVATARTAHFSQFALAALQPSSSSSWTLIGGVIGGAAVVALLVAATVMIRKISRRSRNFY